MWENDNTAIKPEPGQSELKLSVTTTDALIAKDETLFECCRRGQVLSCQLESPSQLRWNSSALIGKPVWLEKFSKTYPSSFHISAISAHH